MQRIYFRPRNALTIYRGYRRAPSQAPGMFSNDPVAGLRAMLAAGKLRDAGEVVAGGRKVRRLIGETRIPEGSGAFVQRTRYDVDARTFAPLGGTLEFLLAHGHRVTMRFHVDRYERLPLTAENAELLTIRTNAQTKVTVHQLEH